MEKKKEKEVGFISVQTIRTIAKYKVKLKKRMRRVKYEEIDYVLTRRTRYTRIG